MNTTDKIPSTNTKTIGNITYVNCMSIGLRLKDSAENLVILSGNSNSTHAYIDNAISTFCEDGIKFSIIDPNRGVIRNLPKPKKNTIYIVSEDVCKYANEVLQRTDVYYPDCYYTSTSGFFELFTPCYALIELHRYATALDTDLNVQ